MDIIGPIVTSVGGKQWIMTMIDDKTNYTEIVRLKNQRVTVTGLQLWISKNGRLRSVRTENGQEFQGFFDEMCNKKDISRTYSAPYCPEQNGKVERFNRILVECTRATLKTHSCEILGRSRQSGITCI